MAQPKLRFKREDGTSYPDWKSGIIGDYYTFKNGLNKDKAAFGKGTPIINYTDVFKNRLLTAKIIKGRVTLNKNEIENHNTKLGDVFFTRTSETLDEVGFCGALIEDIPNCVFSGFLLRGRPIDTSLIAPDFAGYYFMTMPIRQEIISKSSITTRALTNGRNLSAVNIKMPCLEEQQKIADFLSTVDEIIAQSEAEVQNLEQQKKAAMQKIFLQEVRFRREDGTEFPEWETKRISEFANCFAGATPSTTVKEYWNSGTISWLSSGEVNRKQIYSTEKKISQLGYDKSSTKMVKSNTVVMALAGQGKTRGTVAITRIDVCTNQSLCAIETDDTVVDDYLFQYLETQYENLRHISSGDGIRGGLNLKLINDYSVPIPCLEEQQRIANFLSAYGEAIACAKQELDQWKEFKKGLLQQMFV